MNEIRLVYHITELKLRLYYTIATFITSFAVSFFYKHEIMYLLTKPLIHVSINDTRYIDTDITELFTTYMKICFLSSTLITIIYIIYQTWLFLCPGLYILEKNKLMTHLIGMVILFITGVVFSYTYILPNAWEFFTGFQNTATSMPYQVTLEAKISEYISLATRLLLIFGLTFQIPMLLVILIEFKVLNVLTLIYVRKYMYVSVFIFAALISPPDILSQIYIAIPLIMCYELTIFVSLVKYYQK